MTDVLARLSSALADRYRIERQLGEGGMATVYLAEDLRHDRKVAIKVLRPELAVVIGAERFLREIKTIATLQHPHILGLIDSGEVNGTAYYVMPFVEGESLRDRLTREKQLPVADAVRLATEVAAALDYAHRHGVIHRDIKPENVLLHDGSALVADFGIALAVSHAGGTRMTETGMSLGTPHYMSPEQAMGEREITPRSDIYALGAMTYEMLIGEPPFTGPTAQAIIAKVMTGEPASLVAQRKSVPPAVEEAVLTALAKLPADRFASAAEFATALRGEGTRATTARRVPAASSPVALRVVSALAVLAALAALVMGVMLWRPRPEATSWYSLSLGDSLLLRNPSPSGLALSPDGRRLVVLDALGGGQLWLKRWDQLEPRRLPDTERASPAAFSPDGKWFAFTADGRLKRMPADGGPAAVLTDSTAGPAYNIAWMDDGSIVYVAPRLDVLRRWRPASGRIEVALDDPTLRGYGYVNLSPLPGSRGMLVVSCQSGCTSSTLQVVNLEKGTRKPLVRDALRGQYLPTGQLLYLRRDGVVLAAPFSLERQEITGPAIPVLDHLSTTGTGAFAVSASGTLAYVPAGGASGPIEVVRVTRTGISTPIDSAWPGSVTSFALAPDGRRLAVSIGFGEAESNIWVRQLDRGPLTRLSFGGMDRRPAWSADGQLVAFVRDSGNGGAIYGRRADGSGEDRMLARLDRPVQEVTFSDAGGWIVLRTDNGAAGSGDLLGIRTGGDTTPVPLVATAFSEFQPAMSRDGKWLAYTSNESGTEQVYVRPFPATGTGRWQVSSAGGSQSAWSADGRELFYIDRTGRLIGVPISTASAFSAGTPAALFDTSPFFLDQFHTVYAPAPDGRGFLFLRLGNATSTGPASAQLVIAEHWLEELRERLRQ